MPAFLSDFMVSLAHPNFLLGHITYALLIVSMLMRDIAWLRAIAVLSSITKIFYRSYFVYDPVTIVWEFAFVLVNLGQLALLWWETRNRGFSDEERRFIDKALPRVLPASSRRFLRRGTWRDAPAETPLTDEGKAVPNLLFLSEGVVRIERGGQIVAVCGPGDFVGEMSFITGAPASATAVAAKPVRYLSFDQKTLSEILRDEPDLRHALESSFNRNLIDKLVRLHESGAPAT
jgi:Cyclic nucleotide-binding domain